MATRKMGRAKRRRQKESAVEATESDHDSRESELPSNQPTGWASPAPLGDGQRRLTAEELPGLADKIRSK